MGYSREAIEVYEHLLKEAGFTVSQEFEKRAWSFGALGRGIGNSAGIISGKPAGAAFKAAPGMFSGMGSKIMSGLENLGSGIGNQAGGLFHTPLPSAAGGAGLNAPAAQIGRRAAAPAAAQVAAPAATAASAAATGAASAAAPAATGGGMGWGHALGGTALAGGAGLGGYALGQHNEAQHGKMQRNLALGAGAAAGFALPGILRGAADTAQQVALSPTSLFQGYGNRGY